MASTKIYIVDLLPPNLYLEAQSSFSTARFFCSICDETNGDGGGATRPLPRDGGVEELHGDPTVGPRLKAWTRGKNGRSGAEDGAPERLGCGTVEEEVSQILQKVSAGAA